MKIIERPWIKLKETIDLEDYELINGLQGLCIREGQTALKLELGYKLGVSADNGRATSMQQLNEFMYFDGQLLIGYIGISSFGATGSPLEANGMVHPDYRRRGVFKKLSELVVAEWKQRRSGDMLLLSDRESHSGQAFIKGTGAQYKFSEYEMYYNNENLGPLPKQLCGIALRKAANTDAHEIAHQNAIYFGKEDGVLKSMILPEEEEKRGMTIYLAEKDQQIIGKVNLHLTSRVGGIYGLGVLPLHRGKGFGRAILHMAVEKLKEANAGEVMLQVATDNSNALNLYKSCGFVETSTMDYYELKR